MMEGLEGSEGCGGGTRVHQPRSRGSTKEQSSRGEWKGRLSMGLPGNPRARVREVERRAVELVEEAMLDAGVDLTRRKGGLGRVPGVPGGTTVPGREAAERIWAHTAAVLTREPEHVWDGFHQTVRVLQETLLEGLFPEEL